MICLAKKIQEFENINVAAKAIKIQPNQIRNVLLKNNPTAAGCFWLPGKGKAKIIVEPIEEALKAARQAQR